MGRRPDLSVIFCAQDSVQRTEDGGWLPVVCEIDAAANVVLTTFSGDVTENDLASVAEILPKLPGFDPSFSHIIDFSLVTTATVSTDFVRGMAHRQSIFTPDAKQVVVAPQNHIFGMARMVQILREQQLVKVEVVRSLSGAYSILGIDRTSG